MGQIKSLAIVVILFSSLVFTSCSSDDSPGVDNGVSTGNYWPLALNNEWNYSKDGADPTPQKIIGTDTFGGDIYYKLESQELALLGVEVDNWVAKKGGTYYQKVGNLNYSIDGFTISMDSYELPMFKDYLDVNETWTSSTSTNVKYDIDGQGSYSYKMTIKVTGTILERGATITVKDQNYSDVIVMSLIQEVSFGGENAIIESIYWYAKDVGPVKFTNTSDNVTTVNELISYSLNN